MHVFKHLVKLFDRMMSPGSCCMILYNGFTVISEEALCAQMHECEGFLGLFFVQVLAYVH